VINWTKDYWTRDWNHYLFYLFFYLHVIKSLQVMISSFIRFPVTLKKETWKDIPRRNAIRLIFYVWCLTFNNFLYRYPSLLHSPFLLHILTFSDKRQVPRNDMDFKYRRYSYFHEAQKKDISSEKKRLGPWHYCSIFILHLFYL